MKNQFYKKSAINIMFVCAVALFAGGTGAAQKKTPPTKSAAGSSEIASQTTDISAAAQKICKKVKTIDDRTGSDFDLMCGGANGYNFYFWLDSETKKPTGWGYIRNAKIPNFYPLLAIGGIYYEEESEDETPKKGAMSEATEYYNSPDYKAKVGDQVEWFVRGGKTVAYAVRVFFYKDPDNTLTVFNPKKAAAEFIFVRGAGEKYESFEQDLNVREEGNADEQAKSLVSAYFAKRK